MKQRRKKTTQVEKHYQRFKKILAEQSLTGSDTSTIMTYANTVIKKRNATLHYFLKTKKVNKKDRYRKTIIDYALEENEQLKTQIRSCKSNVIYIILIKELAMVRIICGITVKMPYFNVKQTLAYKQNTHHELAIICPPKRQPTPNSTNGSILKTIFYIIVNVLLFFIMFIAKPKKQHIQKREKKKISKKGSPKINHKKKKPQTKLRQKPLPLNTDLKKLSSIFNSNPTLKDYNEMEKYIDFFIASDRANIVVNEKKQTLLHYLLVNHKQTNLPHRKFTKDEIIRENKLNKYIPKIVQKGADFYAADRHGWTPGDMIIFTGNLSATKYLPRTTKIPLFVRCDGTTLLHDLISFSVSFQDEYDEHFHLFEALLKQTQGLTFLTQQRSTLRQSLFKYAKYHNHKKAQNLLTTFKPENNKNTMFKNNLKKEPQKTRSISNATLK